MRPSTSRVAYRHLANLAVAPSAEGHFFDNPEKREVREFAQTDAVTNDPEVAEEAAPELNIPEDVAIEEAEEAPPTPAEIEEEPGSDEFSTLNRFVVETEADVPGLPEGHDEVPKHPEPRAARLTERWFGRR